MPGDQEQLRMEAVSRARNFKRSWVEMAEVLVRVRERGLFRQWGYESLHGYALEELNIKRVTVDKLTGSYQALESHVPHVLGWDGVAQPIPDYDAVDYFAKAVDPQPKRQGDPAPPAPSAELLDDLKRAIFEDHVAAPSLRRRFNPLLSPKGDEAKETEARTRLLGSIRRLESLLTEVDGVSEARVEQVVEALAALRRDLDDSEA